MLSTTTINQNNNNGFVDGMESSLHHPLTPSCDEQLLLQQQQYTPPLASACYCADCYSSSSSNSSVQGDNCPMIDNGIGAGAVDGMSGTPTTTTTGGWFLAPNPVSSEYSNTCSGSLIDPTYDMTNAKTSSHPQFDRPQQPLLIPPGQFVCDCCYPPSAMTTEEFKPAFYNPFEVKHRRRTSRAQFKVLEKTFHENPKPNAHKRRSLAQKLGMTPRGVQVWFQNRRAKAKAQQRREQQQQMTPPTSLSPPSTVPIVDLATIPSAPPMQRQHSNASSSYSVEQLTTPITPMDMFSFLDQHQQHQQLEEENVIAAGKWDLVPGLMYSNNTTTSEAELQNKERHSQSMVTLDRVTETDTTTAAAFAALFDPYSFDDLKRTSYPITQQQQSQQQLMSMTTIGSTQQQQQQQQQSELREVNINAKKKKKKKLG